MTRCGFLLLRERSRVCAIIVFSLFFLISVNAGEGTCTIHAVVVPGAPIIRKDKTVIYGLDLVFDKVPEDYWMYYSKRKKKIVVDFYGVHIKGDPEVPTGRGVFSGVVIENGETKLSLSKRQSRIFIGIKENSKWHFKAETTDKNIIRISAWKNISGLTKIK